MVKLLFICHGNICRSPMAEFLMKKLAADAGRAGEFEIDSAAVSREELGNPLYPPARRMLEMHGVPCPPHAARLVTPENYRHFDLLLVMDRSNLRNLLRICNGDPEHKCRMLMEFVPDTPPGREVDDPWYSGDFSGVWSDIDAACRALLDHFSKERDAESKQTITDL